MSKYVTDLSILRQKSTPTESVEETLSIIDKLNNALGWVDNSVGLAAIQIGIPKRVGVIRKKSGNHFYLINPQIIDQSEEFVFFHEGCLSFPGKFLNTKRYKHIVIKNHVIQDNAFVEEELSFYYEPHPTEQVEIANSDLTAIAIQHEFDHFEGILMIDHEAKTEPLIREDIKVGRNDPCPCGSGKKYKKCCNKD